MTGTPAHHRRTTPLESANGAWDGRGYASELAMPETRYARVGDINIAWQVIGDGPFDLVHIPSWITNVEESWLEPGYARFLRRLASFSRLIVFDKRGTGLSDHVTTTPTLEHRIEDLQAVMNAVGSEQAALFGSTEGAAMCALFAATWPERTRALVMYGAYAKRIRSQVLCSEGDPGDELMVLESGRVRVSRFSASGQETVLAEAAAPSAFGELALIDGAQRSASLTVITEVQIRCLGRQVVLDLIAREPDVSMAMMRSLAAMVRATNERFSDLLSLDVPGRLATWLLTIAGDDGVVRLEQSQESLAHSLGTTRETVNRTLHRFERLGFIAVARQEGRILDAKSLHAIAEG